MQQRLISRTPECPGLTPHEFDVLEQLCFGKNACLRSAEALFIFGSSHGVDSLVKAANNYIKEHQPRAIIISGGIPKYTDSPTRHLSEAQEIANALQGAELPNCQIHLETEATNMQENVEFSLKFLRDYLTKTVAFIGKSHGLTRFGATLRRHISSELVPVGFDAEFDGLLMSRATWRKHPQLANRVWGEALRLFAYHEKGDIRLTNDEIDLIKSLAHRFQNAPIKP